MLRQSVSVTKNDDFHACTGDGDIHAPQLAQEAYLSLLVGAYHGDDNNVALLSLETIYGVHRDEPAERFEELTLA